MARVIYETETANDHSEKLKRLLLDRWEPVSAAVIPQKGCVAAGIVWALRRVVPAKRRKGFPHID